VVPGDRYAYVDNNPLARTDPSGYCWAGCFWQPPSPAKVIKQVVSVTKSALSDVGHGLGDIADFGLRMGEDYTSDMRGFASMYTSGMRNLASDYTRGVRNFTMANFKAMRGLASANTAFAKHWFHESVTFAANPVMNIEYSVPFLGNWFNVRMAHSKNLQKLGGEVAKWASGKYGEEVDGGYAAYLAALNGDNDNLSLLKIGGRTTVVDWLRDTTGCQTGTAANCAENKAKDWAEGELEDWLIGEASDFVGW
jgi:hypothetical protein